jgi:hypothetical protein
MPELLLRGRKVESVFNLLGQNENDITFSIGWALSQSPSFLQTVLQTAFGERKSYPLGKVAISLQEFAVKGGITDVEIRDPNLHVIIEAKRGWELPSKNQLTKYVPRFDAMNAKKRLMVTMSECSDDYARQFLVRSVGGVQVRHIGWAKINALTNLSKASHAEKRLMHELRSYLATIVNMQKEESNWAYVVSLNSWEWAPHLTFIDVVEKRRRYFHPYGSGGWPPEPPNYMAFRYHGRLQSIHHVEHAEVIRNFHPYFPEAPNKMVDPHFLYKLGPAIRPADTVRSAINRNARRWAMVDLLLTSKTIAQASVDSYKRVATI